MCCVFVMGNLLLFMSAHVSSPLTSCKIHVWIINEKSLSTPAPEQPFRPIKMWSKNGRSKNVDIHELQRKNLQVLVTHYPLTGQTWFVHVQQEKPKYNKQIAMALSEYIYAPQRINFFLFVLWPPFFGLLRVLCHLMMTTWGIFWRRWSLGFSTCLTSSLQTVRTFYGAWSRWTLARDSRYETTVQRCRTKNYLRCNHA